MIRPVTTSYGAGRTSADSVHRVARQTTVLWFIVSAFCVFVVIQKIIRRTPYGRSDPVMTIFSIVLISLTLQSTLATGKLVFRAPFHEPRIYEGAPPKVHVTTVHAYDPNALRKVVTYNLLNVKDHDYFEINEKTGNVTTKTRIDKFANDSYHVIVVALSQGETELRQLKITVTEFNRHPPQFEQQVYRGELHFNAPVGQPLLKVAARDPDPVPYNAEIYYRLDQNASGFALDEILGQLTLIQPVGPESKQNPLVFGIFAEDGGSPKRWARAQVEIQLKNISEPLNVRSGNSTDSTVQICWSRPAYGTVLGYIVNYHEADQNESTTFKLNISATAPEKCTTVVRLRPWTDYKFQVFGWNHHELGLGSVIGNMATRPNYCELKICKTGKCHPLNVEPGYRCECPYGYFGETCHLFDPCSKNPCENFASCKNTSHDEYFCDCLTGFSGRNCTNFNPCAIRPSPCLNGASCESTASHTYRCLCTPGYFGKTCQRFNPCTNRPCLHGGSCFNISNEDYKCMCPPGYKGRHCQTDIDECTSVPCNNGATCIDGLNTFSCICPPGYKGEICSELVQCAADVMATERGIFRWDSTPHGEWAKAVCPYGRRTSSAEPLAKRRCRLLGNGTVAWGKINSYNCREEAFRSAEIMTGRLEMLTDDPNNITPGQLRDAVTQIENVINYALEDERIAQSMFTVLSNMLSANESVLHQSDQEGATSSKILEVVDKYLSDVRIQRGSSVHLETDNIALKAVSWDQGIMGHDDEDDPLTFSIAHQDKRELPELFDEEEYNGDDNQPSTITIPLEAVLEAQRKMTEEIRLKFVSYKNDKLFRSFQDERPIAGGPSSCKLDGETYNFPERSVLQASIQNVMLVNLTDPVYYHFATPPCALATCVFWNELDKEWSMEGVMTNQTEGNVTRCFSTHLTAFSILLDPNPNSAISDEHRVPLSIITYIGCGLSILGLLFTILTYSLFRCLNRDRSGKILLNLCVSLLLMNGVFLVGVLQGTLLWGFDVCVAVAILIHYFLLTSLCWMCVEAINMYQLLIHVFASSESRFMLKRFLCAWGLPFIIVGVTVGIDVEFYENRNSYCMLSPANPYVYYIAFLGPSCLILLVNLTVFIMVSRVLFAPRMSTKPGQLRKPGSTPTGVIVGTITMAQVRGAFTVMVLLGVTWVFGALAVGEVKVVFQYIFCVANSLQGFLIFIVRCVQYPEARKAWMQLLKTGTLKRHRGVMPPGSWYGNSSSKQNGGHPRTVRAGSGSSESTSTVVFNSNNWGKGKDGTKFSRLSGSILKNANNVDTGSWSRTPSSCKTFTASLKRDHQEDRRGNSNLIIDLSGGGGGSSQNSDGLSTIGYIDEDIEQDPKKAALLGPTTEGPVDLPRSTMGSECDLASMTYTRRQTLPVGGHQLSEMVPLKVHNMGCECGSCSRGKPMGYGGVNVSVIHTNCPLCNGGTRCDHAPPEFTNRYNRMGAEYRTDNHLVPL